MDLDGLMNDVVPSILEGVQEYNFAVSGSRAIGAYSCPLIGATSDWDIVVEGTRSTIAGFANTVVGKLRRRGFSAKFKIIPGSDGVGASTEPYFLRGREWVAVYVPIGGLSTRIMDIYSISNTEGTNTIIKDGIPYFDMGFLMRELGRKASDARDIVAKAITLSPPEIQAKIGELKLWLDGSSVDLATLDIQFNELEESLDKKELAEAKSTLENAKSQLVKSGIARDILFGALLAGRTDKRTMLNICDLCKRMETQYLKWNGFKQNCSDIQSLCS